MIFSKKKDIQNDLYEINLSEYSSARINFNDGTNVLVS